ncbi:tol-pal system protein YbgF [Methylophaga sp.]|jgi:tol-pal system protein YbgF|uniref:tol-pal system protein YbgF n=1 Tax=Methylophaga sp. TaxID=2024840 RepID=UPI0013FF031E|nr:tol-pal system protein YbgF [Methylophaga sp.]MTI62754.1 tol-pal system protein YbgF [Methylophaga sp.]
MQFNGKKTILSAVILAVTLPGISRAEEAEPLQQRVERLERIIQGQGLMNLITRVDQLQNEVKRLNGENETLRHELEQMQKRQREMYIDLDERLTQQAQAAPSSASEAPASLNPDVTMPNDGDMTAVDEPGETASPDSAPASVENGEAAYQAALQSLRSGQYEEAIAALQTFPEEYPGSIYLPNAYYWQGEAKYVLREFADAAALFQIVIDQYPSSTKVPDALLKRGFSEHEMGDTQRAVATLNQVIQQYPDSSAAKLAQVRLDRINQSQ